MNLARLLAIALIALAASAMEATAQTQGRRADAVVELFTSQGCAQCPRANRLLGSYTREDGVLGLTFPVGIWDYLGWEDTLARPEFGDRQRAYSTALRERRRTPQLVLNGARQVSAADWDDARTALDSVRGGGWPLGGPAELSITRLASGRVRATLGAGAPRTTPAEVWFAAFDPGPVAVEVAGGVNRNRIIMHYNLVERLDRVGTWSGGAIWFERARCGPRCAVILQEPNGGRIIAAAYLTR